MKKNTILNISFLSLFLKLYFQQSYFKLLFILFAVVQAVYPRVQHNLVQNALVPIFADDYTTIEDDDAFIGYSIALGVGNHYSIITFV